jgi:predicted Rdx family selenoprotein
MLLRRSAVVREGGTGTDAPRRSIVSRVFRAAHVDSKLPISADEAGETGPMEMRGGALHIEAGPSRDALTLWCRRRDGGRPACADLDVRLTRHIAARARTSFVDGEVRDFAARRAAADADRSVDPAAKGPPAEERGGRDVLKLPCRRLIRERKG